MVRQERARADKSNIKIISLYSLSLIVITDKSSINKWEKSNSTQSEKEYQIRLSTNPQIQPYETTLSHFAASKVETPLIDL